ncbi:MAG: calcium-binding protein [Pseudomonadota bacterium]
MLMLAGLLGVMLMGAAFIGDFSGDDDEMDETSTGEQESQSDLLEELADGSGLPEFEEDPHPEPGLADDQDYDFNGTEEDDRIIGTTADEAIWAGAGNDDIGAYGGDDLIEAGDGDDTARGGDGADTLEGDAGDDVLYGDAGADELLGGEGADSLFGNNGDDDIFGEEGDDSLIGGEGQDLLSGGDGNDALEGMAGADTLTGGDGIDTLFGGHGDDVVIGTMLDQEGADTDTADFLNGGDGNDSIYAGAGDTAHLGEGDDTLFVGDWAGENAALVKDFEVGEDKLVVIYDDSDGAAPVLQLVDDADFPDVTYLVVNGQSLLAVEDPGDLSLADVELVGKSTVPQTL